MSGKQEGGRPAYLIVRIGQVHLQILELHSPVVVKHRLKRAIALRVDKRRHLIPNQIGSDKRASPKGIHKLPSYDECKTVRIIGCGIEQPHRIVDVDVLGPEYRYT